MKRILALLLTVVMTMSCFAVCAAEVGEGNTDGDGTIIGDEKYTVTVSGDENCTVTVKIGTDETDATEFEKDTELTVSAVPNDDYIFSKWVELSEDGNETKIEGAGSEYTFKVTKSISIKAITEAEAQEPEYTVTVTGNAKVGEELTAVIAPTVEEGTEAVYKWYVLETADAELGEALEDETDNKLTVTEEMEGKYIVAAVVIGDNTYVSSATAAVEEAEEVIYTIDYEKETITFDDDVYVVSTEKSVSKKIASGKTIKPGTTYYIALKDGNNKIDSDAWTSFTLDERPSAPLRKNFSIEKASSYSADDGKIKFPSTDMQYKRDNWKAWKDVVKENTTGLEEGTYLIRYQGSNEDKVFPSDSLTVTIDYKGSSGSNGSGGSGGGNTSYTTNNGQVITTTTGAKPNTSQTSSAFDRFIDVGTHWAREALKRAIEKGWLNGVSSNQVMPDGATTRGMLISILARLNGVSLDGYSQTPYNDVKLDDYFGRAVAWGNANEIISGMGDGTFMPNAPLTREQVAAILYRYAKSEGKGTEEASNGTASFNDSAEISDYAREAVDWNCAAGIMNGRDDGSFSPNATATRAEIATMVSRLCDYMEK